MYSFSHLGKPDRKAVSTKNFSQKSPFLTSPAETIPQFFDLTASLPFPFSEQCTHTPSLQLVQMLQPRQHNLLTRLLDFARQEHLIEYRVDLPHGPYQPSHPLAQPHPTRLTL